MTTLSELEKITVITASIQYLKESVEQYRLDNSYKTHGLCWTIFKTTRDNLNVCISHHEATHIFGLSRYAPYINYDAAYWFPCDEDGCLKRIEILEDILNKLKNETE